MKSLNSSPINILRGQLSGRLIDRSNGNEYIFTGLKIQNIGSFLFSGRMATNELQDLRIILRNNSTLDFNSYKPDRLKQVPGWLNEFHFKQIRIASANGKKFELKNFRLKYNSFPSALNFSTFFKKPGFRGKLEGSFDPVNRFIDYHLSSRQKFDEKQVNDFICQIPPGKVKSISSEIFSVGKIYLNSLLTPLDVIAINSGEKPLYLQHRTMVKGKFLLENEAHGFSMQMEKDRGSLVVFLENQFPFYGKIVTEFRMSTIPSMPELLSLNLTPSGKKNLSARIPFFPLLEINAIEHGLNVLKAQFPYKIGFKTKAGFKLLKKQGEISIVSQYAFPSTFFVENFSAQLGEAHANLEAFSKTDNYPLQKLNLSIPGSMLTDFSNKLPVSMQKLDLTLVGQQNYCTLFPLSGHIQVESPQVFKKKFDFLKGSFELWEDYLRFVSPLKLINSKNQIEFLNLIKTGSGGYSLRYTFSSQDPFFLKKFPFQITSVRISGKLDFTRDLQWKTSGEAVFFAPESMQILDETVSRIKCSFDLDENYLHAQPTFIDSGNEKFQISLDWNRKKSRFDYLNLRVKSFSLAEKFDYGPVKISKSNGSFIFQRNKKPAGRGFF
ncbi:hypothetical protein ACFL35_14685, partial [Candidatus Riflebacteria bacterium]